MRSRLGGELKCDRATGTTNPRFAEALGNWMRSFELEKRSPKCSVALEEKRSPPNRESRPLKHAKTPTHVFLEAGEADRSEDKVVDVAQIFTIDRAAIAEKIGQLSARGVRQHLVELALIAEAQTVEQSG